MMPRPFAPWPSYQRGFMPSNQHPSAPPNHLPLDVLLAVDIDVGWQVGLTTLPGKTPPGDAFPLTDPDNVTHVFEAEYNALMADPEGLRQLKEAAANALMLRHVDLGTEFYLKDFGSAFYRVALCYDCPGRLECAKCDKTGYVTEVFRPYLVGLCYVKEAAEPRDPASDESTGGEPAPRQSPAPRRPSPKRWSWSVPVAVLATVVMAISIGLRFMSESEGLKYPPEPSRVTAQPEPAPPPPPVVPAPGPPDETRVPAPAPPLPPPEAAQEVEPETEPAIPGEPPRKPPAPPLAASPAAPDETAVPVKAEPAAVKNAPVVRLQTALTQLGLYHGSVNGVLDGPTHQALTQLLSMVPPQIKAQYGLRSAALAEAAVRREFELRQR